MTTTKVNFNIILEITGIVFNIKHRIEP